MWGGAGLETEGGAGRWSSPPGPRPPPLPRPFCPCLSFLIPCWAWGLPKVPTILRVPCSCRLQLPLDTCVEPGPPTAWEVEVEFGALVLLPPCG